MEGDNQTQKARQQVFNSSCWWGWRRRLFFYFYKQLRATCLFFFIADLEFWSSMSEYIVLTACNTCREKWTLTLLCFLFCFVTPAHFQQKFVTKYMKLCCYMYNSYWIVEKYTLDYFLLLTSQAQQSSGNIGR